MGLHLITSNGELCKQISSGHYDRKAGVNFYPGDKCKTLESYSNKEIAERRGELFHSLLTRKRSNTAFIPNVGKGEWWERDNNFLGDEGRGWYVIDIDDWLSEDASSPQYIDPWETDTESLAVYLLRALHFPDPDKIEFVAKRSSKAKLEYCPKLHIYVFLNKELNERELLQHFQGYEIDATLAQRGRLHIIQDPLILDDGVRLNDTAGADVVWRKGELLDVSKLKKSDVPAKRSNTKTGDNYGNQGGAFIREVLKDYLEDKPGVRSNLKKIYGALTQCAREEPQRWNHNRNFAQGYILKESYLRTQSFEDGRSLIENNPVILGDARAKDLDAKEKTTLKYLSRRWRCGEVKTNYKEDEIKVIHTLDAGKTVSDEEIKAMPNEGIIHLVGAEGVGKSELIERIIKVKGAERILGVAHKKAVVKPMCNLYGLQDYEQLRGANPNNTPAQNKREMLNKVSKVGTCVQSLHYLLEDEGERLSFEPYDIAIYDENEHTLEKLLVVDNGFQGSGLDDEGEPSYFDEYTLMSRSGRAYLEAARYSKLLILADAKTSDLLTGSFVREIQRYGQKKKILLLNEANWIAEMVCNFHSSVPSLLVRAKELIDEGKNIVFQTDFANGKNGLRPRQAALAQALRHYCELELDEVKAFNSKNFKNVRDITIQNNPNTVIPMELERGARIILCSPFNTEGWSYKGDGISETFNIYESKFIHAEDIKQGFRRWRKTMRHNFYIRQSPVFAHSQLIGRAYEEKLRV